MAGCCIISLLPLCYLLYVKSCVLCLSLEYAKRSQWILYLQIKKIKLQKWWTGDEMPHLLFSKHIYHCNMMKMTPFLNQTYPVSCSFGRPPNNHHQYCKIWYIFDNIHFKNHQTGHNLKMSTKKKRTSQSTGTPGPCKNNITVNMCAFNIGTLTKTYTIQSEY